MSRAGTVGLLVGLWLGFIWAGGGFGEMALTGLVGVLGFLVARALTDARVVEGLTGRAVRRR